MLRTVLHHLLQELDDDLGRRTDQHLALAALLGIEDAAKAVVQHRDAHHPEAGEESWSELWEAASEAKGEPRLGLRHAQGVSESIFPADVSTFVDVPIFVDSRSFAFVRSLALAAAACRRQLAAIPEACLCTL